MTKDDTRDSFTERLIEQDAGISPTSLQEQRMKIQSAVDSLDRKAGRSQRFTVRAIAAVVVGQIYGLILSSASPWLSYMHVIAPVSLAATMTAAVAVVRYWTIHRPQLEKGQVDLQVALFQELQRQILELQQQR